MEAEASAAATLDRDGAAEDADVLVITLGDAAADNADVLTLGDTGDATSPLDDAAATSAIGKPCSGVSARC